jgi:hypothetical protein
LTKKRSSYILKYIIVYRNIFVYKKLGEPVDHKFMKLEVDFLQEYIMGIKIFYLSMVMLTLSRTLFAGGEQEHFEPIRGSETGQRIELELEPGPYYSKDVNYIVYKYTVWPQVAVWLETLDGDFIETIYVTRVVVDQDFDAAPKNGRPEALPVWSHKKKSAVDAVTSPTTVDGTVKYGNGIEGIKAGTYMVKLETNRSYDWNDAYPKSETGVNGQPSLVYEAEITIGELEDVEEFIPVGTGSVDGSDGNIRPGINGIDTALELFSSMYVSYKPR